MTSNEFRSNVGQVVNGNAASDATTVTGNVLNVSFTAPEKDSGPPVTKDQRSKLFQAVRRLLIALGKDPENEDDRFEIYALIRAEFSLKRIEDLPASKYKEALFFIDKLMPNRSHQVNEFREPEVINSAKPCTTCSQLDQKLNTWKKLSLGLLACLIILGAVLLVSVIANSTKIEKNVEASLPPEQCSYNGINHSLGAKVKMADNQLHECTSRGIWQKLSTNKDRVAPKRIRNDDEF